MKRAVNTYKGLVSDIARDTIQKGFYIDALNIRITTDTGESMGCITNIQGNKFFFELPQDDEDLPVQGTLEIIGACSIRNTIIIFVADDSGENGWIFKISYEETNQNFISLDLIYKNEFLNFNKDWPIEAIGRYESGQIQRVYWTDYNNFLRSINVADPNTINLNIGLVDIFPNIDYVQPILTNVIGGGAILSGSWQYAYRLITLDGKETLISPPGNMIHTTQDLESELQDRFYNGNGVGVNTNKSHEVTINTSTYGIFEKIELIGIYSETFYATPQVFSIEKRDINNQASITFTHTGLEETIFELEPFEYIRKAFPFKTVKTLAQKDNSLVVANIKGGGFDLQELLGPFETFNAKTARYNSLANGAITPHDGSTPEGELNNAFNTSVQGDAWLGLPTIPPTLQDITTGYNTDEHYEIQWHQYKQFKYQADGLRLGGEGPNIKYTFHLEPFIVDNAYAAAFPAVNDVGATPVNLDDGIGNYTNLTWKNNASPFISGLLRGYKRGETYRFGIVFYNLKGEASFVEYIGDIKFPDISNEDSVVNESDTNYFPLSLEKNWTGGAEVITEAYALGIKFEIDLSTCPSLFNKISGYQIVRVRRDYVNSRRLCSGTMRVPAKIDIYSDSGTGGTETEDWTLESPNDDDNILHLFSYHNKRDADDNPVGYGYGMSGSFLTLNNENVNSDPWPIWGTYMTFYSPEVSFRYQDTISNINSNSCLLMTGRYGQYYSSFGDNMSVPGETQIFDNNPRHEKEDPVPNNRSLDLVHSAAASTESLGRSKMQDYRRKLRSVGQVKNNLGNNGIEYIKKWNQVSDLSFRKSAFDDVILKEELDQNLGPYVGFTEAGTSVSIFFRNHYAFLGNTLPGLNDHTDGGTQFLSIFHKGASGITGSITKIAINPLNNTGVTLVPDKHYFDTGVGGLGPVAAVPQTFFPLNKSIYDENGTSTPIIDILNPRKEVYGGFSPDALQANIFQPASPVISLAYLNPKVYGGDIFLGMWCWQDSCGWIWDKFYQNAPNPGGSGIEQEFDNNRTMTTSLVGESRINLNLPYSANVKTEVKFSVGGGSSGVQNEIWRQENNNFSSQGGKRNTSGQYAMYFGVYNDAYSAESDDLTFFVKPDDFNSEGNVNDIRAYLSNVKINEELVDSWTQFGINNYYDVDDYGPINKILAWRDDVYYFQDTAIGKYSINPRAVTSTEDGISTELGSADGIQDHKYFTNKNGAIHQWAVKETDAGIYCFDGIHKKILRIREGNVPLSEMKNIHGLLKNFQGDISLRKENEGDNPIREKGVHITRDQINNEVIFTFLGTWEPSSLETNTLYSEGEYVFYLGQYYIINNTYTSSNDEEALLDELIANSDFSPGEPKLPQDKVTLVFDEIMDQFSSRYSATPPIYIENGDILLSADRNQRDRIYIHNKGNWGEFYGKKAESSITLVLNENADINKILRFIEFNSIVRDNEKNIDREQTITAFRIKTEYQDTGKINFASGRIKRRFDKWRVRIPQVEDNGRKNRLRSTYFELSLYFNNNANRELILDRIMYYYDIQIL